MKLDLRKAQEAITFRLITRIARSSWRIK